MTIPTLTDHLRLTPDGFQPARHVRDTGQPHELVWWELVYVCGDVELSLWVDSWGLVMPIGPGGRVAARLMSFGEMARRP